MASNRPADFAQSGSPPDACSSRGPAGHTIGFRRNPNGYRNGHTIASAPATNAAPPPPTHQTLPKRPKGQLLIGTVFCCCLVASAYFVWDGLFRYEGYGVVNGRVLAVSPAWEGIVPSGLLQLNIRVDGLELDSSVVNFHLPFDTPLE
jgi:hypothetical protein